MCVSCAEHPSPGQGSLWKETGTGAAERGQDPAQGFASFIFCHFIQRFLRGSVPRGVSFSPGSTALSSSSVLGVLRVGALPRTGTELAQSWHFPFLAQTWQSPGLAQSSHSHGTHRVPIPLGLTEFPFPPESQSSHSLGNQRVPIPLGITEFPFQRDSRSSHSHLNHRIPISLGIREFPFPQ